MTALSKCSKVPPSWQGFYDYVGGGRRLAGVVVFSLLSTHPFLQVPPGLRQRPARLLHRPARALQARPRLSVRGRHTSCEAAAVRRDGATGSREVTARRVQVWPRGGGQHDASGD